MESTILFDEIIFGPVISRRLGLSLGINLLPLYRKVCNYNCVYCECGLTSPERERKSELPEPQEVGVYLRKNLLHLKEKGRLPDSITFAGNGEPTLHPDFGEIMDITISLRDELSPESKITVLSNATKAGEQRIFSALKKADNNILKLDTAFEETFRKLNHPPKSFTLDKLVENLKKFRGDFIMQSLFVRGHAGDIYVDNTMPDEINGWLLLVKEINPREVMIYTIERNTPFKELKKVPADELKNIAREVEKLKIKASVYT